MKINEINTQASSQITEFVRPILLQVCNSTSSNVKNFDVFNAMYLEDISVGGSWSSEGNFTLRGITIRSLVERISYREVLTAINSNPFVAGAIYFESLSGSRQQILDSYYLTYETIEGNLRTEIIRPLKNPYQPENKRIFKKVKRHFKPCFDRRSWKGTKNFAA